MSDSHPPTPEVPSSYPPPPGYPGAAPGQGYAPPVYGAPPTYVAPGQPPQQPPRGRGLAIAALVVGIVAFCLGWMPFLGIVLGLAALILGIIALVRRSHKAMSIIGLVLGILGLITSLTVTAVAMIFVLQGGVAAPMSGSTAPLEYDEDRDGATSVPVEPAPVEPAAPVDLSAFAELSDAEFAALIADPMAHLDENVIVYGEVFQLGDEQACSFIVTIDNQEQESWEEYLEWAIAFAYSSEQPGTTCPETGDAGEYSHVALWATVLGAFPLEFEDGVLDVVAFDVHHLELLPELVE